MKKKKIKALTDEQILEFLGLIGVGEFDKKNKESILTKIYYLFDSIYWKSFFKIENFIIKIKMAYQRVVRGYDDQAMWNFDEYVARQIKENCFIMAEEGHGYPNIKGMTDKKWKQILLDISFGFGSYLEMRSGIYETNDKEFNRLNKEYRKGMAIFVIYHEYLWD